MPRRANAAAANAQVEHYGPPVASAAVPARSNAIVNINDLPPARADGERVFGHLVDLVQDCVHVVRKLFLPLPDFLGAAVFEAVRDRLHPRFAQGLRLVRKRFDEAKDDLGHALLLKKYTAKVVDATPEQIRLAAADTIPRVAPMFWSIPGSPAERTTRRCARSTTPTSSTARAAS